MHAEWVLGVGIYMCTCTCACYGVVGNTCMCTQLMYMCVCYQHDIVLTHTTDIVSALFCHDNVQSLQTEI